LETWVGERIRGIRETSGGHKGSIDNGN
jgi:hypothetical protein